VLDRGTRQLLRRGIDTHVEPKVFDFLDLLLRASPRAVPTARLHDDLWPGTFVSDSSLKRVACELRRALGEDARRPRLVRTIHGFGYAFAGVAVDAETEGLGSGELHARLSHHGREIALREGENLLGRAHDVAARIDSPGVSRHHARIVVSDGRATLEDLGSLNGTYLRGERVVSPSTLLDGDEIRLGRISLTFRSSPREATTRADSSGT
jgi:DNA-binding winged helix-turn-helix (wHTH) protein